MLSGVAKSGSPISRWTILLPSASRRRAFARTSNALSVPSRDIRSANFIVTILVDSEKRTAIDAQRLPCDVARLLRAKKGAGRTELRRIAQPTHGRSGGLLFDPLLRVGARGRRDLPDPVGEDSVRRETVDGHAVTGELASKSLRHARDGSAHRIR